METFPFPLHPEQQMGKDPQAEKRRRNGNSSRTPSTLHTEGNKVGTASSLHSRPDLLEKEKKVIFDSVPAICQGTHGITTSDLSPLLPFMYVCTYTWINTSAFRSS